jgi:hypothetical protein
MKPGADQSTKLAQPAPSAAATPVIIPNGTLEALKWLGLVLMTLDHTNKYLFDGKLPIAFEAGRLAMPIFGFVLAANLARPGAFAAGLYGRTMRRLAIYGVIATPFFLALADRVGGWWPLNILFMLLTAAGVACLLQKNGIVNRIGAIALFALGGSVVEFWWFGVAFVLAAKWYVTSARVAALIVCALPLAGLQLLDNGLWALAALPLMVVAPHVDIRVPRLRHVFYVFYPLHLALLWLVKAVL